MSQRWAVVPARDVSTQLERLLTESVRENEIARACGGHFVPSEATPSDYMLIEIHRELREACSK